MNDIITGYLSRKYLVGSLEQLIQAKASVPVPTEGNQGFALGHSLGYQDAMKKVIKLVKELPDEPKPPTQIPKPWHHG